VLVEPGLTAYQTRKKSRHPHDQRP